MSALDTEITIDGDVYAVRRDFDLIKRIEQRFGALSELDQKLRVCAFTASDLVAFYKLVLASQYSPPPVDHIETYVLDAGIRDAHAQLAILVMQLFAGHRKAIEWMRAEAQRTQPDGDHAEDPLQAV